MCEQRNNGLCRGRKRPMRGRKSGLRERWGPLASRDGLGGSGIAWAITRAALLGIPAAAAITHTSVGEH